MWVATGLCQRLCFAIYHFNCGKCHDNGLIVVNLSQSVAVFDRSDVCNFSTSEKKNQLIFFPLWNIAVHILLILIICIHCWTVTGANSSNLRYAKCQTRIGWIKWPWCCVNKSKMRSQKWCMIEMTVDMKYLWSCDRP